MMIPKTSFLALLALLATAPLVSFELLAQEPRVRCPEATADAETLLRRLQEIAASEPRGQTFAAISHALRVPFASGPCPVFRPEVDPDAVLAELMIYAMANENERVAGSVMQIASSIALDRADRLSWSPTALLLDAVSTSRTDAARVHAVRMLIRNATDPSIRARLLIMLREPAGPSAWPDLPSDVLAELQYMFDAGAEILEADLLAAPHLVRNPLSKWLIACGRGHPTPRSQADPCHPQNAPARIETRNSPR